MTYRPQIECPFTTVGNIEINYHKRTALVQGVDIRCTYTEFHLFWELAGKFSKPYKVVSHDRLVYILEQTGGRDPENTRTAVAAHLKRVRQKLRMNDANVRIIPFYAEGYALEVI